MLRLIEEEAMKKGTERVIAHLPIDCATFLLNEKRAAIQELEARLSVSIMVLPSKHLETPSYDIERIKSLEGAEDKTSHQFIKEEEIALPEFVKQTSPKVEKAAVKEFLPDAPAPVQNKKNSGSLIQRFWQKLVGSSAKAQEEGAEKSGEAKSGKSRNNRRDRNGRSRRNKRNNSAANAAVSTNEAVTTKVQAPVQEKLPENAPSQGPAVEGAPKPERSPRRSRNRRRGRGNGERAQQDANNNRENTLQEGQASVASYEFAESSPRSYANEYAERKQAEVSRSDSAQTERAPGGDSSSD